MHVNARVDFLIYYDIGPATYCKWVASCIWGEKLFIGQWEGKRPDSSEISVTYWSLFMNFVESKGLLFNSSTSNGIPSKLPDAPTSPAQSGIAAEYFLFVGQTSTITRPLHPSKHVNTLFTPWQAFAPKYSPITYLSSHSFIRFFFLPFFQEDF